MPAPTAPPPVTYQTMSALWPGYLSAGYFDDQGHLRPEFVRRDFMDPLAEALGRHAHPSLTTGQLRRFFGHCRVLELRLRNKTPWTELYPKFLVIDAAATDAWRRKPAKIPELFHDFILINAATVKTERDFVSGFMPHFAALVGFGAAHFKR